MGCQSVLPGWGKCDSQKRSNGGTTAISLDWGGERVGTRERRERGDGVKMELR